MKKFFSLSAIVAVLAMLMTSVSVSSCSSDDDDDSVAAAKSLLEQVLTSKITTETVAQGDTVAFYNVKNGAKGILVVTAVSSTSVTFSVNGTSYTLGDAEADASYLTYANSTYATSQLAQAKANPTAVVLVKLAASQTIASGKKASNTTISGAATETVFVKK